MHASPDHICSDKLDDFLCSRPCHASISTSCVPSPSRCVISKSTWGLDRISSSVSHSKTTCSTRPHQPFSSASTSRPTQQQTYVGSSTFSRCSAGGICAMENWSLCGIRSSLPSILGCASRLKQVQLGLHAFSTSYSTSAPGSGGSSSTSSGWQGSQDSTGPPVDRLRALPYLILPSAAEAAFRGYQKKNPLLSPVTQWETMKVREKSLATSRVVYYQCRSHNHILAGGVQTPRDSSEGRIQVACVHTLIPMQCVHMNLGAHGSHGYK